MSNEWELTDDEVLNIEDEDGSFELAHAAQRKLFDYIKMHSQKYPNGVWIAPDCWKRLEETMEGQR